MDDVQLELESLAQRSYLRVTLQMSPLEGWFVLCAIQWVWRLPWFDGPKARFCLERVGRALQELVATSPALRDLAERGWEVSDV